MAKKVLFTATVDSHILQFHLPYLKWFKEQGYEVHVATNGDEEIPYCDFKHKISFERSPFKLNNLKAIKDLKKIIDKEHFDIIHTHTPMGSVVTRLAAKKARKKYHTRVMYTAHGFHFYKGAPIINWLLFYPVEKHLSRYTDTLILINKEDYELAKKKFKAKQIELVNGVGVDENKFNFEMTAEEKHKLRQSLGLEDDDFVIIYVAELLKRKNQGMLIKAAKELIDEDKNIKVLLPGMDSEKGYYQKMAKDLGIEDNIKFLGYRKDIPKLLKISNLYVSTAKQEGLPVNVMEAMSSGLPIIATDCRGNRDLIEDCIEINNIDLLKNKIIARYNIDEKTRQDLIEKNKKTIEKYELKNVIDDVIKIYTRQKRVLHVLASNIYSGAENVACTIIKNCEDAYDMAYCSTKGPIAETLKEKNIKFYGMDKLNIHNLRKVIKEYKPDIIHAHDFTASCIASFFSKKHKIVSQLHQNPIWLGKLNLKTILYNFCSKKIDRIVVVSNSILNEYYFKNSIKGKSVVIYNYVDYDKIIKMSEEKFDKNYDLCFFGRLNEAKNPLEFIEIVNEVKKRNEKITACMIGDGELKDKCNELINKYELEKNIELLGFNTNPYKIVKNCKCVIMPSIYEGFGLAAIESLILGVPVLNSGVGGLKEIFEQNKNNICKTRKEYMIAIDNALHFKKQNYQELYEKYANKEKWIYKMKKIYTDKNH